MIQSSFEKCKSNEDLADLLSLMIEQGYASNVIEMTLKIKNKYDLIKSFDNRIYELVEEMKRLSISECYRIELDEKEEKLEKQRLSIINTEEKSG